MAVRDYDYPGQDLTKETTLDLKIGLSWHRDFSLRVNKSDLKTYDDIIKFMEAVDYIFPIHDFSYMEHYIGELIGVDVEAVEEQKRAECREKAEQDRQKFLDAMTPEERSVYLEEEERKSAEALEKVSGVFSTFIQRKLREPSMSSMIFGISKAPPLSEESKQRIELQNQKERLHMYDSNRDKSILDHIENKSLKGEKPEMYDFVVSRLSLNEEE